MVTLTGIKREKGRAERHLSGGNDNHFPEITIPVQAKPWAEGHVARFTATRPVSQAPQGGLHYTPVDVEAMSALMDAGQLPEDVIYKQGDAMSKQYSPEHNVDLTVSYKWNCRKVSHTLAFEGVNILMNETPFAQRFDLRTRSVRTDKVGISLPNLYYRLDF